jgi:hypothetical protein
VKQALRRIRLIPGPQRSEMLIPAAASTKPPINEGASRARGSPQASAPPTLTNYSLSAAPTTIVVALQGWRDPR